MAVTVKVTETYDMKTTVNKMGLVAIHTPSLSLIRKLYPGLLKNHRFIRFVKADVVGACASVLPADPLQVGVSAGDVAPEDMFNPILYTAVSNTSFDTLIARINNLTGISALGSVDAGDFRDGATPQFNAYYALLADNGRFRKAMPQAGFSIRGLVPLCHTLVSTFGNYGPQGNKMVMSEDGETPEAVPNISDVNVVNDSWTVEESHQAITFRGRSLKMPKFPIHTTVEGASDIPNPNVPETMVLALILPPAKLNEFYYRMRVSWTVRFEEVCSTLEAGGYGVWQDVGGSAHAANYTFSKSETVMEKDLDMASSEGVELNKIMES